MLLTRRPRHNRLRPYFDSLGERITPVATLPAGGFIASAPPVFAPPTSDYTLPGSTIQPVNWTSSTDLLISCTR